MKQAIPDSSFDQGRLAGPIFMKGLLFRNFLVKLSVSELDIMRSPDNENFIRKFLKEEEIRKIFRNDYATSFFYTIA